MTAERIVHSLEEASRAVGRRRTVCCAGVFDGVHRGHQHLVETAVAEARRRRSMSLVLTFRTHPLSVLAPAYAPPLLTEIDDKLERLKALKPSCIAAVEFNHAFAGVEPEAFVDEVLARQLRAVSVFCGADFRFGREGRGDLRLLEERGRKHGIAVGTVEPVYLHGRIVSSTWTRALVEEGQVEVARECLGRCHVVRGTVVRGEGRGKHLGFPTANIATPASVVVPGEGIYAGQVEIGDRRYGSAIHIGPVPTFGVAERRIEAYIFDFDDDLVGRAVGIHFVARLRDVQQFDTPDELIDQIRADSRRARRLLKREAQ
jgi:riboflavin kinase/FMN adenylyltransferase